MKRILIVDDDIYIGDMMEEALRAEGYGVLRAWSGTEALYVLESDRPDLILLDLMLPGISGEGLLPQIQGIPVIVVSAKVDVEDKVALLLGGAVDYITKPFSLKELLARVSVALRDHARQDGTVLTSGDLRLDTSTHEVFFGSEELRLTRTEFAILETLMRKPDQVITKALLLEDIAENTPDCTESSLKTHISNLRRKLRQASGQEYIGSVWGIGFRLLP